MNTLRILLADDHEMLRRGLRATLLEHRGWEVCGEASNGREAIELAQSLKPDVIIMDVTMPDLNGMEATRRIRRFLPETEVLILTFDQSEALAREAVAAGASGYVLKNDVSQVLIQAVETVAQHRPFFSTKVMEAVERAPAPPDQEGEGALTAREREIVQLVAEGKSTKGVADALGISAKTAENHRSNILRKLKLHSATELVRYAIRNKIAAP